MSEQARPPTEDDLSPEDRAEVERMAQGIIDSDKARYQGVMAEIDKDEREFLEKLRRVRMRRAAVEKAGHYGNNKTAEQCLFESIQVKARADTVYEMTIEELIAWWGRQRYTPIGQATLNHLERLQRAVQNGQVTP